MRRLQKISAAVLMLMVSGFGAAIAMGGHGKAVPVAVSDVPKAVLAAAQKAVAGIQISEATAKEKPKGTVYELEGTAGGSKYELKITADGKVLKIELEDADENGDEGADEGGDEGPDDEGGK